ncbi:hypothetical protein [Actinopolymorpha alba]|uniref:hypothetical protein n=1 Tax=Actinopolymorpha alba TaxID=533267 RepID=UPI0012F664F1|nr:hypothetical protein [Actinopolymorpha alba]
MRFRPPGPICTSRRRDLDELRVGTWLGLSGNKDLEALNPRTPPGGAELAYFRLPIACAARLDSCL